jgi:hypothetical protein
MGIEIKHESESGAAVGCSAWLGDGATCRMWIGRGEDCGKPAEYRVKRESSHNPGLMLCAEHVSYYKARPDTYVVIALESPNSD